MSMDLITNLPRTNNGNDSIWVVVDRLSKVVHLVALTKTCTAESIAAVYEKEVFRSPGIPETIVSDRDVRFTSRFWRDQPVRSLRGPHAEANAGSGVAL